MRAGLMCFGEGLEHVINYRRLASRGGWRPHASPYDAWLSERGDEIEIGGLGLRAEALGYLREGIWHDLLRVQPARLTFADVIAHTGKEPLVYAQDVRSDELWPGVRYQAQLGPKGFGKLFYISPETQRRLLGFAHGAETIGIRYTVSGELADGWRLQNPFVCVERRGGRADGTIRRDGERLLVLFEVRDLARLLPGEWVMDPAITQESVGVDTDDCYDNSTAATNATAGYNARDYFGQYSAGTEFAAGWRFTSVPVPQGSSLNTANLQVYRRAIFGTPNLRISGDDADNAGTWTNGATTNRPGGSGVTLTTAFTNWTTGFGAGDGYLNAGGSNSITAIIAEIVQRAGWAEGALRLVCRDNGGAAGNYLATEDFSNGATNNVALLDVDFIAAGGAGFRGRIGGGLIAPQR